jgi:DNA primase
MPGLIPENILEDILDKVDIVEIISSYIPLKRAGRNFKALCPFHHEKTPSFIVSPDRQIFHCFGCSESGNAFKFLMRYERMEFLEAAEVLAKKAGVILPSSQKQDGRSLSLSTQLYKVNELASQFYQNYLESNAGLKAKNYLFRRSLSEETINTLQLGLASDKWDNLLNYLRSKNINLTLQEKAGLIISKDTGGYYDRFRNRIIFPIIDVRSRVLGFGARVLDEALPKYINSPETPTYTKGKNLYGLNLAKDSIIEKDSVVVVEGYLDFAIPYQGGLKNIVASLGTALTPEQVRILKRYTHNAVMIYDADTAGEVATIRSLDLFIEEDMDVKVVSLTKGTDPDSFVRKNGIDALKEKVEAAQGLFDFKLKILRSRYDARQIQGKVKIAQGILETLSRVKNSVLKSEYLKKLSQELDIKEEALLEELKKIKPSLDQTSLQETLPKKEFQISPTEKLLIKLMLQEKDIIGQIKNNLEPADFQNEKTARIVSIMFDLLEQGRKIEPSLLMSHLKDDDISQVICESVFMPDNYTLQHKERVVDDCIQRIKKEKLKLTRQRLHEEILSAQQSGDEERLQGLMEEFYHLTKKR